MLRPRAHLLVTVAVSPLSNSDTDTLWKISVTIELIAAHAHFAFTRNFVKAHQILARARIFIIDNVNA
jgi:hypothetical protein